MELSLCNFICTEESLFTSSYYKLHCIKFIIYLFIDYCAILYLIFPHISMSEKNVSHETSSFFKNKSPPFLITIYSFDKYLLIRCKWTSIRFRIVQSKSKDVSHETSSFFKNKSPPFLITIYSFDKYLLIRCKWTSIRFRIVQSKSKVYHQNFPIFMDIFHRSKA